MIMFDIPRKGKRVKAFWIEQNKRKGLREGLFNNTINNNNNIIIIINNNNNFRLPVTFVYFVSHAAQALRPITFT